MKIIDIQTKNNCFRKGEVINAGKLFLLVVEENILYNNTMHYECWELKISKYKLIRKIQLFILKTIIIETPHD